MTDGPMPRARGLGLPGGVPVKNPAGTTAAAPAGGASARTATAGPRTTKPPEDRGFHRERATRIELATSSLGSWHSTAELRPRDVRDSSLRPAHGQLSPGHRPRPPEPRRARSARSCLSRIHHDAHLPRPDAARPTRARSPAGAPTGDQAEDTNDGPVRRRPAGHRRPVRLSRREDHRVRIPPPADHPPTAFLRATPPSHSALGFGRRRCVARSTATSPNCGP